MATGRDLVIGLQMDGRNFARGADAAGNKLREFGKKSERFGSQFQRSSSKSTRSILELSRGVEDFSVQFGTQGFSGGLRGAANNLSQFAFIAGGPALGALAGLGVAGASMWSAFNTGAKEGLRNQKNFNDELKRSQELENELRKMREFRIDVAEARGAFNKTEAIGAKFQAELNNVDKLKTKMDQARREVEDSRQKLLERFKEEGGPLGIGQGQVRGFGRNLIGLPFEEQSNLDEAQAKLKLITQQFNEAAQEAEKLRKALRVSEASDQKAQRERLGEQGQRQTTEREKKRFEEINRGWAKVDKQIKAIDDARQQRMSRGFAMINREMEKIEQRRKAALKIDPLRTDIERNRDGRITGLGVDGIPKTPQLTGPDQRSAGTAVRGSAAASKAIADSKRQENQQKQLIDEVKKVKEAIIDASQVEQGEVVINSFSGVA